MKELILKALAVIIGLPLLFVVGSLLFSLLSLISSAIIFILVVFLVVGLALMLWAIVEEKVRLTRTDEGTDSIIIIEGKVRHKN
jgi:protein-S-isoprenylcysteine O-methyltransferase Ste14